MPDSTGKIDLHLHTNKSDGRLTPTDLVRRVHKIVANLAEVGVTISVERVFAIAGEASVGRPHVAQALLEAGYIKAMPEAFEKWLAYGGPGDVPRDKLSPEDAIGLIHSVGGLAVVAHPYEGKNVVDQLPGLDEAGLDGVETYYQGYGPDRVDELLALCGKLGILPTGGSDFHGFPLAGHEVVVNYPGSVEIPPSVLDDLATRRAARLKTS